MIMSFQLVSIDICSVQQRKETPTGSEKSGEWVNDDKL